MTDFKQSVLWKAVSLPICKCLRMIARASGIDETRLVVACDPFHWLSHFSTFTGYVRAFGFRYAFKSCAHFLKPQIVEPAAGVPHCPAESLAFQPLISIFLRYDQRSEMYLRAALDALERQTYRKWELVLVVPPALLLQARVIAAKYHGLAASETDSASRILAMASGEFCAVLTALQVLDPQALAAGIMMLNRNRGLNLIVAESDYFLLDGDRFAPGMMNFNSLPEVLKDTNLDGLCLIRCQVLARSGVFPGEPDDNREIIRAAGIAKAEIPSILVHHRIVESWDARRPSPNSQVKALAFYLPQFHPIPENDAWWGQGFTEWTNVRRGKPMFPGHDQPRRPGELGYYDLVDEPQIMPRQIELAKSHGLHGFCFYYYWFDGVRLLEKPLERLLNDPSLDFPFCVCWANESWTRTWDGLSNELLIEQKYSPDSDERLIRDLAVLFRDKRYIRVNGAPMLLIYNVGALKNPKASMATYRRVAAELGFASLHIVICQVFGWRYAPGDFGADAAVEFPPHCIARNNINAHLQEVDESFCGEVLSYDQTVDSVNLAYPGYPLYRTAMLAWDNSARKQSKAHIFHGFSPYKYKKWLTACRVHAEKFCLPEARFLFINAWNEWAEGTYLEPDARYGTQLLEATSQVLKASPALPDQKRLLGVPPNVQDKRPVVLFVTHDTNLGGAQVVLLSILRYLSTRTNCRAKLLALSGGNIRARFENLLGEDILQLDAAPLSRLGMDQIIHRVRQFCGEHLVAIYGNSVACCRAYALLSNLGAPIITHVHELQESLSAYAGDGAIRQMLKSTTHYIACSPPVAENLRLTHSVPDNKLSTICAFIDVYPVDTSVRDTIRKQLNMSSADLVVAGCGIGLFWRKGADLFVKTAWHLAGRGHRHIKFIWVGGFHPSDKHDKFGHWADMLRLINDNGLSEIVRFLGVKENVRDYLSAADVFFSPSREDPFPLVCLEAASVAKPVICFEGSGGMPDFIGDDAGRVVAMGDYQAAAECLLHFDADRQELTAAGRTAQQKLLRTHCTEIAVPRILQCLRQVSRLAPRVSVIVPIYNGRAFIHRRLSSIFSQRFRDYEVIVIDDCSTDDSVAQVERFAHHPELRIVRNERNLGVFGNWLKGISMARGEIVWIAEQDDWAAPDFLSRLVPAFNDPRLVLAYCSSSAELAGGELVADYFQRSGWFDGLPRPPEKWTHDRYAEGIDEIRGGLAIKNTIPNASAALIRRSSLASITPAELMDFRCGGDWYIYIRVLRQGRLFYCADNLNFHARRDESVVGEAAADFRKTLGDYFLIHDYSIRNFNLEPEALAAMDELIWTKLAPMWPHAPIEDLYAVYPPRQGVPARQLSHLA